MEFGGSKKKMDTFIRAVFRVTERFPLHEPLRVYIRERALLLFSAVIEDTSASSHLSIIEECLKLASEMDWLERINFEVLIRECHELYAVLLDKNPSRSVISHDGVESVRKTAAREKKNHETTNFTERQKMIIEHLHKNGQVKISDFFSEFNALSSKTIQRELHDLVAKNVLKKEGEKRWRTYTLNVR